MRQLVAETDERGVSVPMVAEDQNLNGNLVFKWHRLFHEPGHTAGVGRFVRVVVEGTSSYEAGAVALGPGSDDDVAVERWRPDRWRSRFWADAEFEAFPHLV